MTQESKAPDYRIPSASKWAAPRAVADGGGGTIIAVAEIAAPAERVFDALTTDEVERWWAIPIITARQIGMPICAFAVNGT